MGSDVRFDGGRQVAAVDLHVCASTLQDATSDVAIGPGPGAPHVGTAVKKKVTAKWTDRRIDFFDGRRDQIEPFFGSARSKKSLSSGFSFRAKVWDGATTCLEWRVCDS